MPDGSAEENSSPPESSDDDDDDKEAAAGSNVSSSRVDWTAIGEEREEGGPEEESPPSPPGLTPVGDRRLVSPTLLATGGAGSSWGASPSYGSFIAPGPSPTTAFDRPA